MSENLLIIEECQKDEQTLKPKSPSKCYFSAKLGANWLTSSLRITSVIFLNEEDDHCE